MARGKLPPGHRSKSGRNRNRRPSTVPSSATAHLGGADAAAPDTLNGKTYDVEPPKAGQGLKGVSSMARARLRRHSLAKPASPTNYAVGRGKTPATTRWQKGQSGNPNGRRVGSKNLKTVVVSSANARVTVKDGGRRRNITKLEAAVKALADKAARGDARATQQLVQMVQKFDGGSQQSVPSPVLEGADKLVVEQLFIRIAEMVKKDQP
jgi:hypothetical protein